MVFEGELHGITKHPNNANVIADFVQDAIEKLMHNRTVIVIAHRLSTVYNADKIIVLDKGLIIDMGTHKELINKDGLYKQLHNLQFKT